MARLVVGLGLAPPYPPYHIQLVKNFAPPCEADPSKAHARYQSEASRPYRGTSLTRDRSRLGPYVRTIPRAL